MSMNNISNRIIIAFLKRYNIKRLVLSSGTRNIPFCNAVETDPYFECFSVVDERNAAFFALGLSQKLGEPVALACTSGTAVSNYLSGMTEAYYSHTPLVAITFDRSPYVLDQLETQKINQPAILKPVTKKSVQLPVVKDSEDLWYFERVLNEAFIAMNQHGTGPIHLNVPMTGGTNGFYTDAVDSNAADNIKFIDYLTPFNTKQLGEKAAQLSASKKVMLVMGQSCGVSDETASAVRAFCKKFNCPILADNLANFSADELIFPEAVIKALNSKTFEKYLPDIVITFGTNFQERIKDLFKAHAGKVEHWAIEPEGKIKDVFKSQTVLFEGTPEQFFDHFAKNADPADGSGEYLAQWQRLEKSMVLPEMPFTNFYTMQEFSKVIPDNSILHLSILNCTRLGQFFKFDNSIKVFSNVNSFGIDGCLPTFMGQAYAHNDLAFLVIGDLSFFYAMNAISIKHRKNNIRILLINNGGGAEFHIQPDANSIPTIDLHIGCSHERIAKDWAVSSGYKYLSANNKDSLKAALADFVSPEHDSPVLLEVFTNMKTDGEFTLSVYRELEKYI